MIKQIALIIIMLMSALTCSQSFAMGEYYRQTLQYLYRLMPEEEPVSLYSKDPFRFGKIDINSTISSQERSEIERFKRSQSASIPDNQYISSRTLCAYALEEHCNAKLKDSILATAVYLKDYYLVKQALLCKANPNARDNGDPIIFKARNLNIIKLLIAHGASLPREGLWHGSLLHTACSENYDWPILQYYIKKSVCDINHELDANTTPLHQWAHSALGTVSPCEKNISSAREKLRLLLDAGADPTRKDVYSRTALDILKSSIKHTDNKSAYSGLITMLETAEKKYNEKQVSS